MNLSKELEQALIESEEDIKAGRYSTSEEVFSRIESRYPFLRYPHYTKKELTERVKQAFKDAAAGRGCSSEELHRRMEKKYPFLCK